MPLPHLLAQWQSDARLRPYIAAWRVFPARDARTAPLPADVHPALVEWLGARGITALYTHQAMAWQLARDGKHIVVVTGTASGKTLCYNLPVLDRLWRDEHARALYLFPTKALAQDQRANLTNDEGRKPSSFVLRHWSRRTMAIRPSTRARRFGGLRASSSPIPICCTPAFCRITPCGRNFSGICDSS